MTGRNASTPKGAMHAGARALRFLCTNDDGIQAAGLELLIQAAEKLGEVFVVAPDRQRSASSQSLSLHKPLRPTPVAAGRIALDGTPTDCVLVAISELCEQQPDFVLSGVNHGPNMGEDVLYSGTVAAALEGTILGVRSIAVSFAGRDDECLAGYGDVLERLLQGLVTREDFSEELILNINLPDLPANEVRGARVTVLGSRRYHGAISRRPDSAGRECFWIGGGRRVDSDVADSDFAAVDAGHVSITPLHLDLTNRELIDEVRRWPLEL